MTELTLCLLLSVLCLLWGLDKRNTKSVRETNANLHAELSLCRREYQRKKDVEWKLVGVLRRIANGGTFAPVLAAEALEEWRR